MQVVIRCATVFDELLPIMAGGIIRTGRLGPNSYMYAPGGCDQPHRFHLYNEEMGVTRVEVDGVRGALLYAIEYAGFRLTSDMQMAFNQGVPADSIYFGPGRDVKVTFSWEMVKKRV